MASTISEPPPERWGDPPAVDLPAVEPLRWTRIDTLLDARNEKFPSSLRLRAERGLREGWLTDLRYSGDLETRVRELTVEPHDADSDVASVVRFAILGDPGEGDLSQLAVVRPLLALHRRPPAFAFAVVLSDVIYPSGDSAEYPLKFYGPYHGFRRPIYAIPGNHDWDDGSLTGFMTHFARSNEGARVDEAGSAVLTALEELGRWRRVWHGAKPPTTAAERVRYALAARDVRDARLETSEAIRFPVGQPGSYFRLRVGPLWLIGIDTGMTGTIDQPQAQWLLRVSEESGPKILLTGKPLVVNGASHPCRIAWGETALEGRPATVAEIVATDRFRYLASIGGDVHNYQRYQGATDAGRPITHLVAGGSGAFLSSTELIGVEEGTTEVEPAALYPTRGLSRVHFEWGVANRLLGSRLLPGVAAFAAFVLAGLFALLRGATFDAPSARVVAASIVSTFAVLALWRLHRLTRSWTITSRIAAILAAPIVLSLVVPFEEKIRPELGAFFAGYGLGIVVFALLAITLGRKLAAPQGMTIRERRPYSTVGLAAAAWLMLMLVLASYGTLATLWTFSFRQATFVVVTALAVLAAGILTHFEVGRHLARVFLVWIVLVVAGTFLLFGWGWHDEPTERQALRYGFFEAVIALLVGMGLVIAALTIYAKRLQPAKSPEGLAQRVAEAESEIATRPVQSRHELIAAILRAVGASSYLGPIFEASDPPMLKSLLDVQVAREAVTITAYRASGFETEADDPPTVDRVKIPIPPPPG